MSLRARLSLRPTRELHYDEPPAAGSPAALPIPRTLPVVQLWCRFDVVRTPGERTGVMCEGRVSTGEPLTVFPQLSWITFADRIQRLPQQPRYPRPEPWLYRDKYEFWLGRVHAAVYDSATPDVVYPLRVLRAVPVLGLFLMGSTPDVSDTLLGFRHGLLTGRRLVCEPSPNEPENYFERWWLEASAGNPG